MNRSDFFSFLGDVLLKPIIDVAGLDISHWFDPRSRDIRHHIDPVTHCLLPYTPHGRFIHIPPPFPSSDFSNDFGIPWWKDEKYKIGVLSKKVRTVRILNVLTLQDHLVEVNKHFYLFHHQSESLRFHFSGLC